MDELVSSGMLWVLPSPSWGVVQTDFLGRHTRWDITSELALARASKYVFHR